MVAQVHLRHRRMVLAAVVVLVLRDVGVVIERGVRTAAQPGIGIGSAAE